jgi:hypothetical protein
VIRAPSTLGPPSRTVASAVPRKPVIVARRQRGATKFRRIAGQARGHGSSGLTLLSFLCTSWIGPIATLRCCLVTEPRRWCIQACRAGYDVGFRERAHSCWTQAGRRGPGQRVRPGALLMMPGFGGGLSYCAHLVRWGDRTAPLGESKVELPQPGRTAPQLIQDLLVAKTTPSATPTPF